MVVDLASAHMAMPARVLPGTRVRPNAVMGGLRKSQAMGDGEEPTEAQLPDVIDHIKIVVLRDAPADSDAFGGHVWVANAIAEIVQTEPGGRTIGLEGGWGSGKSTIVRLVCDQLSPDFRAFVFDAWAHEGDPLRRSFLEALITDLIDHGWIGAEVWRLRIEELARRRRTTRQRTTQELTRNGRWLAASLFVVPVGAALPQSLPRRERGSTPVARWPQHRLGPIPASACGRPVPSCTAWRKRGSGFTRTSPRCLGPGQRHHARK